MQAEEEGEDELEYDEHIWLSLKNAAVLTDAIAEKLGEKDGDRKDDYIKNAAAYREKLEALDGEYASAVANARYKTLIFADRFPFRYLMDDYGLEYYAAFSGCSAESDPTLSTLMFLAEKLDALKLPALITIDGSNQKAAKGVLDAAKSKDVKILTLNSMQSAADKNDTYLSIMENNLSVLKQAVSG